MIQCTLSEMKEFSTLSDFYKTNLPIKQKELNILYTVCFLGTDEKYKIIARPDGIPGPKMGGKLLGQLLQDGIYPQ